MYSIIMKLKSGKVSRIDKIAPDSPGKNFADPSVLQKAQTLALRLQKFDDVAYVKVECCNEY